MPGMNKQLIPAAIAVMSIIPSFAALTYPGCADMVANDFTITSLVTNSADTTVKEPTKMALTTNDQGNVDVYFVQRYGKVRKYDGTSGGKALTLANFNFGSGSSLTDTTQIYNGSDAMSSEGLQGIALDPGFKTNHWMYLYFCMKGIWRVTRYTLVGNTLDLTTAKTILRFTHTSFAQHLGSALRFDWDGNLWITVADNGGTNWPADQTVPYQAANSNKYFGKILRIIPRPIPDNQPAPAPGLGGTYDVPAGNLRQRYFDLAGSWGAGQDTNKILPEIYVMGNRNPYSIALDSVRKAVAWGEVGPDSYPGSSDTNQWTEEFNFTTQPGFFGWPFWAGKHTPMPSIGWTGYTGQPPPAGGFGSISTPYYARSDSATAITHLPPAQPAMINYVKNCAITGPIYYYDGSLNSAVKFPPHLNGAWFIGDFNSSWINAVELNAAGTAVLSIKKMFSVSAGGSPTLLPAATAGNSLKQFSSAAMNASNSLLDMQMGSDGALYVMNYSGYRTYDTKSGLIRITYNGSCHPTTTPTLPYAARSFKSLLRVQGLNVSVLASGNHTLEVRDLRGKMLAIRKGNGPANYSLTELKEPGVYLLHLSSNEGQRVQKIVKQ